MSSDWILTYHLRWLADLSMIELLRVQQDTSVGGHMTTLTVGLLMAFDGDGKGIWCIPACVRFCIWAMGVNQVSPLRRMFKPDGGFLLAVFCHSCAANRRPW